MRFPLDPVFPVRSNFSRKITDKADIGPMKVSNPNLPLFTGLDHLASGAAKSRNFFI